MCNLQDGGAMVVGNQRTPPVGFGAPDLGLVVQPTPNRLRISPSLIALVSCCCWRLLLLQELRANPAPVLVAALAGAVKEGFCVLMVSSAACLKSVVVDSPRTSCCYTAN